MSRHVVLMEKKQESKDPILMERKLGSTGSESSSYVCSSHDIGDVNGQVQPSSALGLEQSTGYYSEAGGFLLPSNLALELGMQPGEMIFRSMFYGTSRASYISGLTARLLAEQEDLLRLEPEEGTSSVDQLSQNDILDLVEFNAAAIQALMDSIEAPRFGVVQKLHDQAPVALEEMSIGDVNTTYWNGPGASDAMVVDVVDTTCWQAPGAPGEVSVEGVCMHEQVSSAPEQVNFDEGSMFIPNLSLKLGMCPDQSMFYGSSQSDVALNIANQISEIQEDLLHGQELGGPVVSIQGGASGVGCEDTAALVAASGELMQDLMGCIESPSLMAVSVVGAVQEMREEGASAMHGGGAVRALEKQISTGEESMMTEEEKAAELARMERMARSAARIQAEKEAKVARLLESQKEKEAIERAKNEEKVAKVRAKELEEELEIARSLESDEMLYVDRMRAVTEEEIRLELDWVKARELELVQELEKVRESLRNLVRVIDVGRVVSLGVSGRRAREIERKKMRELTRDMALARVRELELDLGILRTRLRARMLDLELERFRHRERDSD